MGAFKNLNQSPEIIPVKDSPNEFSKGSLVKISTYREF